MNGSGTKRSYKYFSGTNPVNFCDKGLFGIGRKAPPGWRGVLHLFFDNKNIRFWPKQNTAQLGHSNNKTLQAYAQLGHSNNKTLQAYRDVSVIASR